MLKKQNTFVKIISYIYTSAERNNRNIITSHYTSQTSAYYSFTMQLLFARVLNRVTRMHNQLLTIAFRMYFIYSNEENDQHFICTNLCITLD